MDGEIIDRIALYREPEKRCLLRGRQADQFIAEVRRYNPRVIDVLPDHVQKPIPFFALAKRFTSIELVSE